METFAERRRALHLPVRLRLGWKGEQRKRRRLARAVRLRAEQERERCHRAEVIKFESIAIRTALYGVIARRVEDLSLPVSSEGLVQLESLLAEPPPFRDYGPAAHTRNDRIESVAAALR